MIVPAGMSGKRIAVMGLGKTGFAVAASLRAAGAEPLLWDDSVAKREEAETAGYRVVDPVSGDLTGVETMVWSPGIPHTLPKPHPAAVRARTLGIELVCDIDLLGRADPQARYIGITGTNGKSTTTALIGHILDRTGHRVAVGGNIGTPVLTFEPMGQDGIYVLELSSYQIELTRSIVFDVGVHLNLTPDHIDRHGDMEGYYAVKKSLFNGQRTGCTAVVGVDDDWGLRLSAELAADGGRAVRPVSVERETPGGVYVKGRWLVDDLDGNAARVADVAAFSNLLGRHNHQNAAVAYAVCRALGVAQNTIVPAIKTFPGLAHRQQTVATILGVRFVNDSKATNADATAKALTTFQPIYWILGGKPKDNGLEGLEPWMGRVRHAFLIGQATDRFAAWLDTQGVSYSRCGTLDVAVSEAATMAWSDAASGATVLLSPACASFDQFPNFEKRGEAFVDCVRSLSPGEAGA